MVASVQQQLNATPVQVGTTPAGQQFRKIQGVQNSQSATWATGSTPINLPLDLLSFSTTTMLLRVHANLSIASASSIVQDPWDRLIASLSIVSDKSDYYVQAQDLPSLQQVLRWKGVAAPRISLPSSASNVDYYVDYPIHFGLRPFRVDRNGVLFRDKYDLTAGIPPMNEGQLSIIGTWGIATALAASGVTINSADLSVRFWGAGALPGKGSAPMPQATPIWQYSSQDSKVASVNSVGAARVDVPNGNFLRAVLVQTGTATSGVLTSRADSVLTDLALWDTDQNHKIFGDSSWIALAAESQDLGDYYRRSVPEEGASAGTVNGSPPAWDPGQFFYDFVRDGSATDPMYGSDQRNVPSGRLQWQFGNSAPSNAALRFYYLRYNPVNPGSSSPSPSQAVVANQGTMNTALAQALARR